MHSQLVVLGGGPGGYAAAFLAADSGLEVTLVDASPQLGGTCLSSGCIPSKALLHVGRVLGEIEQLENEWGIRTGEPTIDLEILRARKEKIVTTLSGGLGQLAKRRKIRRITARGHFVDPRTLRLVGDDPALADDDTLTFDDAIIATGSLSCCPGSLSIESDRVMNSTDALALVDIPESLLVVGGGYIGLEMASVYSRLGSRVSVVELTDGLLQGADRDLVKPLQRVLDKQLEGRIYLDTRVVGLADLGSTVEVQFEGANKQGAEQFDRVLIAVGRVPNSHDLGLDAADVTVDSSGFIVCDDHGQTSTAHIRAVGDVAGEPMLAHKASHQGRAAVESILGHAPSSSPSAIPAVVFTDPEIAWVGLTAEAAQASGREISAALYPWAASGRAQAIGRTEGMTKWIIDPETEVVLGCGIVGAGAGELIGEATLAINQGCKISDVGRTIHAHPTMSETLMNAADVFYGTATEVYKPRRNRRK